MHDLFATPEACLLADVIQQFREKNCIFSPRCVVRDVREAIEKVHITGKIHKEILRDPPKYLVPNPELGSFLMALRKQDKRTFLLTNSPFTFVDQGMQFILKDFLAKERVQHWTELFNLTVCQARKPDFFAQTHKAPFRVFNKDTLMVSFEPVNEIESGKVYVEGALTEFNRLFNSDNQSVIFMGDSVYADLRVPSRVAGWRTAAIIKEIKPETTVMMTTQYEQYLRKLLDLETLIDYGQNIQNGNVRNDVANLKSERSHVRQLLKKIHNSRFGSVFRTPFQKSYFFSNVGEFADIYTSNVTNFLNYPPDFCFYSKRQIYPHEPTIPTL